MFNKNFDCNATGTCDCGRSPTGDCNGWHALSEEDYLLELAEWEINEHKRRLEEINRETQ